MNAYSAPFCGDLPSCEDDANCHRVRAVLMGVAGGKRYLIRNHYSTLDGPSPLFPNFFLIEASIMAEGFLRLLYIEPRPEEFLKKSALILLLAALTLTGIGAVLADTCWNLCSNECEIRYQANISRCASLPTRADREACEERAYWYYEGCYMGCSAICD